MSNPLTEQNVWEKLKNIEDTCHRIFAKQPYQIPKSPGREVEIRPIRELPSRRGLSFADGQARLLHDLASIELQAMELAIRTLIEFPEAPAEFREDLGRVALEEAKHLKLCLQTLETLGFEWGSFPTHLGLWQAVAPEDTLLDRILIVHRYLEGSGLDASHGLLNKLVGAGAPKVLNVIRVIATDEMGHVEFGSDWYRRVCRIEGLDPERDFPIRIWKLSDQIPKRLAKINKTLRKQAGFIDAELVVLEEMRQFWLDSITERAPRAQENANDPL